MAIGPSEVRVSLVGAVTSFEAARRADLETRRGAEPLHRSFMRRLPADQLAWGRNSLRQRASQPQKRVEQSVDPRKGYHVAVGVSRFIPSITRAEPIADPASQCPTM